MEGLRGSELRGRVDKGGERAERRGGELRGRSERGESYEKGEGIFFFK